MANAKKWQKLMDEAKVLEQRGKYLVSQGKDPEAIAVFKKAEAKIVEAGRYT